MPKKTPAEIKAWEAEHGLGATWGDEENRAAVLVFDVGSNKPGKIFATGIRNCVGLTMQPKTGDLWCTTNERDMLGDDLVPDYSTRVKEGGFYGWPWYYMGKNEDPRLKGDRPDLAGKATVPDVPYPGALRGAQPDVLHRHVGQLGVPEGIRRRRLRGAARLVEPRVPHRPQGRARADEERRADRRIRGLPDRLHHRRRQRMGPPGGCDRRAGRIAADQRRRRERRLSHFVLQQARAFLKSMKYSDRVTSALDVRSDRHSSWLQLWCRSLRLPRLREIVIPGEKIFPESITSAKDGSVIIGSIGARTIWRAQKDSGNAEAWIQPGTDGMQGVFGVFADDKAGTLYACSGTFGPPGGPPPPPSALHTFDLETGAPKGHYPMPTPGAFCNDIAVDSDGNAYASDTSNMQVARLKKGAKALEVWAGADGAFGPKGGVLDGIAVLGNRVLVNALLTSKLFSVPIEKGGKAGGVTEVKLDRAIERPDGMRSFGKDSLLVVEGGGRRASLAHRAERRLRAR